MGCKMNKLVAFLIVVAALVAAVPASAFQFGIEDDTVLVGGYYGDANNVYNQGKQLHADVVRMMIDPSLIQADIGVYDWTATDRAVDEARAHGYRIWMTLNWSPWSVEDFSIFAGVLAKHYQNRVADYTLINEPDYVGLRPNVYRNFFIKGRASIRWANPQARVYVGELSGIRPSRYMQAVLKDGPLRAEGFAWHPYQFKRPPESQRGRPHAIGIGRIKIMRSFLRSNVRRLSTANHKPLGMYLTEFGYLTRGRNAVSERQAAIWWPRAIRQAKKNGARLLIAYQVTCATADRLWDSSLIASDGRHRSAFEAIANA